MTMPQELYDQVKAAHEQLAAAQKRVRSANIWHKICLVLFVLAGLNLIAHTIMILTN